MQAKNQKEKMVSVSGIGAEPTERPIDLKMDLIADAVADGVFEVSSTEADAVRAMAKTSSAG